MKKGITILFILATVVFCALLYGLLDYADNDGNVWAIIAFSSALVLNAVLLVWLYNKYFSVNTQKPSDKKTQVSSQ